ncbi:hypothetical protein SDC9_73837 [bioreactor metagenome]|uniref:Putative zinc ribbon domain-containing protein n=1 Tax=bioreactor metagenome TaxID=1076179 RepID=A0A644YGC9_9ZZZZ
MMEAKICQSCGMPMGGEELYGTEKDGGKNPDYCKYCYEGGAFTFTGTMEEMAEICVPPVMESTPGMTAEAAKGMMMGILPTLKRWKA